VDTGFLRGDALGLLESVQGFADLASHGVGLGHIEQLPCLPFWGQARGIDLLGQLDGLPGVAELDGDVDGVDGDVGGPELGAVVVAVLAELSGDRPGGAEVLGASVRLSRGAGTARTRCDAP
jgi:hypothetical protein